jgi:hypothetical protein
MCARRVHRCGDGAPTARPMPGTLREGCSSPSARSATYHGVQPRRGVLPECALHAPYSQGKLAFRARANRTHRACTRVPCTPSSPAPCRRSIARRGLPATHSAGGSSTLSSIIPGGRRAVAPQGGGTELPPVSVAAASHTRRVTLAVTIHWRAAEGEDSHDELELRAVCFGCGLERTENPVVKDGRPSACLVCGETRVVIDQRLPSCQRPVHDD